MHVDANAVLRQELVRRGARCIDDVDDESILELVRTFAVWIPVDTYVRAPWLAPYAIRRLRHRVEVHAPGPKRDLWGLPDGDGYFTDDNSLIKAVVLRSPIAPETSPYGAGKITRGLVCCHVWAGTTANPLLFSFVPNLVWLPTDLARFSDAHLAREPHKAHRALKLVASARFRSVETLVAKDRVSAAWRALPPEPSNGEIALEANEFVVGDKLVRLVEGRLGRLTQFLAATLDESLAPPARFSKRYHAGAGARIDRSVSPVQVSVPADARQRLLDAMRECMSPTADRPL